MELYLVRHGEVPSNVEKTVSGFNDEKLTWKGIQQALQVKERIKDIEFAQIICSPVPRAIETAQIIAPNKDIILDYRLQERNPGTMLGHKRSEINRDEWSSLEKEQTIYGGETLLAGLNRTRSLLAELEKEYDKRRILLITHMFICKCVWMLENDVYEKDKIEGFFQQNNEIRVYTHVKR